MHVNKNLTFFVVHVTNSRIDDKITEKAVWKSAFLCIQLCIFNADSTKTHSSTVTFVCWEYMRIFFPLFVTSVLEYFLIICYFLIIWTFLFGERNDTTKLGFFTIHNRYRTTIYRRCYDVILTSFVDWVQATSIFSHKIILHCNSFIYFQGGMKGVIWTDVFQTFVIVVGLIVVIVIGSSEAGGIMNVYEIAKRGGRLNLLE